MTDALPPTPGSAPGQAVDRGRLAAVVVCALQSLALAGFCVFYLYELVQGAGDDAARVVMSAVLIAVFAVGLGALARAWRSGADWPRTPTVVWNALLLPVAWSLFQGGLGLLAALLAVVALAGIVSAIAADTSAE